MYFSASNSLSVNGQPIINNFYQSNAPTAKELKEVETNMAVQDLMMESLLLDTVSAEDRSENLLVSNTTGLGISLDIFA